MVAVEPDQGGSRFVVVTGPSRSGKSRWAESLLAGFSHVIYVATSPSRPDDTNWQERIQRHRDQRPSHWTLLEPGPDLSAALGQIALSGSAEAVLIDALGAFVAAHLDQPETVWQQRSDELQRCLAAMPLTTVLVCEETGWGVVPPTAIGGLFRDRLGQLGQRLNAIADDSWLVVQGRAINLHQLGHPVP